MRVVASSREGGTRSGKGIALKKKYRDEEARADSCVNLSVRRIERDHERDSDLDDACLRAAGSGSHYRVLQRERAF